jgi:hypothetical protein
VAGEAIDVKYRVAPVSEGLEITVKGERPPREVTRRTLERRENQPHSRHQRRRAALAAELAGRGASAGLAGFSDRARLRPEGTATSSTAPTCRSSITSAACPASCRPSYSTRSTFYPGNFSAQYGRKMGGVVDVKLRKPDTKCNADYGKPTDKSGCFHGMAQGRSDRSQGHGAGPVADEELELSGRGSLQLFDKWLKPALESAGTSVHGAPVTPTTN